MARSRWLLAGVFLGGMLALGFLDYVVSNSGYEGIATGIWAVGYGTIVLGVWFVWLRPLDFTEPSETESRAWSVDADAGGDDETDADAGAETSSDETETRPESDTTSRSDGTTDRTERQSSSEP